MARLITTESAAMRLARTIASDILAYNDEKVREGLANDDLFERLADELNEGRRHFDERTEPGIRQVLNLSIALSSMRFPHGTAMCLPRAGEHHLVAQYDRSARRTRR